MNELAQVILVSAATSVVTTLLMGALIRWLSSGEPGDYGPP